ncbi:MAG: filamentous hemagglutinin N-terminal domain-containing protein [Pleurocapsa sp.]
MLSLYLDRLGFQLSFTILGLCWNLIINPNITLAQIVSDDTTGTRVNVTENLTTIAGGTQKGQNLFHSFAEFSVNQNASAYFDNALGIERIFSRVTGGSISEINGSIRANGNADLFLLNPAGIIFGANGSLALGGSFIATTSDRLLFADGSEFRARDTTTSPLLTISMPVGLQYGANPGKIAILPNANRSFEANSLGGLNIQPGNTLALLGGDVTITRNDVNAFGGNIELGSIQSGIVKLDSSDGAAWKFDYSGVESFGTIALNRTLVNTRGIVHFQGGMIELSEGSVISNFTRTDGQGGSITLQATDSIQLDNSSLFTQVGQVQTDLDTAIAGTGGNITLQAPQLKFTNGSLVSAGTLSQGAGGDITLIASDSIELSGGPLQIPALVSTSTQGSGTGGEITINTGKLTILDGSQIQALAGMGAGGTIAINATEAIELRGQGTFIARDRQGNTVANLLNSGISASSGNDSFQGNSGNLSLDTPRLTIAQGAEISVSNFGTGDAGDITVDTTKLNLATGGKIIANTASGKGGSIAINSLNSLILQDDATISTTAQQDGNGGNIAIATNNLVLLDFNRISANAQNGTGGNIAIDTRGLFVSFNSSITASSELGTDGVVDIITPEVNSTIETTEQERSPLTAENYIATGCSIGQDFTKNQFRYIGRGGLPPNPMVETAIEESLADLGDNEISGGGTAQKTQNKLNELKNNLSSAIVEATTWQINPQGKIELVTEHLTPMVRSPFGCQD